MAAKRIAVAKTYKIYIDGKFPRTESGRYFTLEDRQGNVIANLCRGSRKDFRNSVVAARKAQSGWGKASAYLRGQILYRIAELLEGRREQFIAELQLQGSSSRAAETAPPSATTRFAATSRPTSLASRSPSSSSSPTKPCRAIPRASCSRTCFGVKVRRRSPGKTSARTPR